MSADKARAKCNVLHHKKILATLEQYSHTALQLMNSSEIFGKYFTQCISIDKSWKSSRGYHTRSHQDMKINFQIYFDNWIALAESN